MSDIMVSVIMTTYNHEKYISQALDSVLMQKVDFRYEVIVGEDCSTDNTKAIVEEYAKKYPDIIKPVFREKNTGGKFNAFDIKVRSRGKYMAFLEGDDYWTDENKLACQVEFLEKHPEYIGVVHKYDVVNADGKPIKMRTFGKYKNEGIYTISNLMKSEIPSQLATFVIRNIYKEDPEKYKEYSLRDNTIQGDIKMSFFLAAQGNIYRMDNVMSVYRLVLAGGNNWTSIERRNPRFFCKWEQIVDLEKYAKQDWGIDLYMKHHRKVYSSRTILNVFRCKNKESFSDMVKILRHGKKSDTLFLYLCSAEIYIKSYIRAVEKSTALFYVFFAIFWE